MWRWISRLAAAQALALFCGMLCVPPVVAQGDAQQAALDKVRRDVLAAGGDLRRAAQLAKKACDDAEAADEALLRDGLTLSTSTRALAVAAALTRLLCDQTSQQRGKAGEQLERARTELRMIAAAPAAPAAAPPLPPAAAVAQQPDTASASASGKARATHLQMEAIVIAAATAQDDIEAERTKVADLYNVADTATKLALLLPPEKDKGKKALQDAQTAQSKAKAARGAVSHAQSEANRLVELALALKLCLQHEDRCDEASTQGYADAVASQDRLAGHLKLARTSAKALGEIAIRVEATKVTDNESDYDKFIRFRQQLQSHPDARSLLGKDSYLLSADSTGTSATIQLGYNRPEVAGVRRYTMIVSTPLSPAGRTKLYEVADGLAGTTQVTFAANLVRGGFKVMDTMTTMSAGLTLGRDERSFFATGPGFPKEASKVVYPISLSLVGAAFGLDDKDQDTQVFKVSAQRTFTDATPTIRCPVDLSGSVSFVECINGSIGEPKRGYSRLYAYQYRKQFADFAVAPALSYNDVSGVIDLDVPLYLIRSAGEGRPFNAGINLGWSSKGKTAITQRDRGQGHIGVFIGAPFSLFEVGR